MDRLTAMLSFVRVVECGSFAAAATVTDRSPAMIGNHVRYLENRLSAPLLNRSTRRQVLTEFERAYYERCRHILQDVEAAEAAHGADTKLSGILRVTAPTVLGTTVLPASIARAVHLLGVLQAAARERDHDRRQRFGGELVRARHQNASRDDGFAFRQPGLPRGRNALRDRGQDGVPGACRAGLHRRWRHADERHQRDDHDLQVLAELVQPEADRDGAEQPGPEPGHVGGAVQLGSGKTESTQAIPDFAYHSYAELLGLRVGPGSLFAPTEASEHKPHGCPTEERQRITVEAFPIFGQTPAAVQPRDGALHDPTLRQYDEFAAVAAAHDLDVHSPAHPSQTLLELWPLVATVGV